MDTGTEAIDDEAERAALARQARAVYVRSVAATVLLTAAALLLPHIG